MVIDNKIDSLPFVVKIMAIVPLGFAFIFFYVGLWFLGLPLFLLVLTALTTQQRIRIDFEKELIKNYYRILWINFGKWNTLKHFHLITITPETTVYRERNYTWNPNNVGAKMYEFRTNKIVLNLKINNRDRYVIAKGRFNKILKLAELISVFTQKDILDCTLREPQLVRYCTNNIS